MPSLCWMPIAIGPAYRQVFSASPVLSQTQFHSPSKQEQLEPMLSILTAWDLIKTVDRSTKNKLHALNS